MFSLTHAAIAFAIIAYAALQSPLHASPLCTGDRAGGWCLCNYRRCDRRLCGLYWRTTVMRSCCLCEVVAYEKESLRGAGIQVWHLEEWSTPLRERHHENKQAKKNAMTHRYILKGVVETVLAKSHNLASAFAGAEQGTSCSARRSSPKGMVVSETSSGKNVKRKVAPTGPISRRDKF
ncbi:hypothetical protein GW17_00019590 [Ensete ventricosum]|nr:hypothetical protein GW17_00019590 [Ensete ventricosum]